MIVCIGRELGSGGRDIGRMLAEQLGCAFYDRELLNLAARESGFSEEVFARSDEQKHFFRGVFNIRVSHIGDTAFYNNKLSEESLFKFQSDAIRTAAAAGSCVFVGRCADYVLRDRDDMVSVFITADVDDRVKRMCGRVGLTEAEARKTVLCGDADRAAYYNYYTGKKWGYSATYDLCVNSSVLGIERTEEYIRAFIRAREDTKQ